jgi:hypothetical protein
MKLIGITGLARSGKDVFCKMATKILTDSGYCVKKYAFADTLKNEIQPFLRDVCGVDVWTNDTEIKKDIRDFLVWYGTTFWRKRQPNRWIKNVELQLEKDKPDIALISDVRYPNEGHWIHSFEGFLIHLTKYHKESFDGGRTWTQILQKAPNEQEMINDPLVKQMADDTVIWEDLSNDNKVKISMDEVSSNIYLIEQVYKSLLRCPGLSQRLIPPKNLLLS